MACGGWLVDWAGWEISSLWNEPWGKSSWSIKGRDKEHPREGSVWSLRTVMYQHGWTEVQEAKSQWEWAEDNSGARPCRSCWPGSGSVVLLVVQREKLGRILAEASFCRFILNCSSINVWADIAKKQQQKQRDQLAAPFKVTEGKPLWPYGPRYQDQQERQRMLLGTKNDRYWERILCWEWMKS